MIECGYVYILSSGFKRLYIGVTNDLQLRVEQHKGHKFPNSFTARYGIDQLVYFERFAVMTTAIAREKELKGWTRAKKIALIVASNPTWKDLSADWGKPIPPWSAKNEARVPAKYRDSSPSPSLRSGSGSE